MFAPTMSTYCSVWILINLVGICLLRYVSDPITEPSERRLTQTHERSRLLPEQSLRISGASLHNIRASFRTVMFPGLGYGTVTSSPYPSDRKHIVVIDVEANISSPLPDQGCIVHVYQSTGHLQVPCHSTFPRSREVFDYTPFDTFGSEHFRTALKAPSSPSSNPPSPTKTKKALRPCSSELAQALHMNFLEFSTDHE